MSKNPKECLCTPGLRQKISGRTAVVSGCKSIVVCCFPERYACSSLIGIKVEGLGNLPFRSFSVVPKKKYLTCWLSIDIK